MIPSKALNPWYYWSRTLLSISLKVAKREDNKK